MITSGGAGASAIASACAANISTASTIALGVEAMPPICVMSARGIGFLA
jgi:hypothetical protein